MPGPSIGQAPATTVGSLSFPMEPTDSLDALRAAAVAGHLGDRAAARTMTGHPDPEVRAAALGAMARLGDVDLAPAVTAALGDGAPSVRRRAAELGAAAGAVPLAGLVRLLSDADALVAEAACWALGERQDPAGVDALVASAGVHPDPLVREAAVAALGAIGCARGLPAVLAATRDKPAVRRRAVLALAPFDGPEVEAALRDALDDRDWQVRQGAEDLLNT